MLKIDGDFIKKRNELLLENKDGACDWGKNNLEIIEKGAGELISPAMNCSQIIEHSFDCPKCAAVVVKSNNQARSAMGY